MGDAEEENACIAEVFDFKEKKKKNKKKTAKKRVTFAENEANSPTVVNNDGNEDSAAAASGVRISLFDFSVENFFRDMDTIARLCGKENGAALDQSEVQRLSSSVTFLREWRDFKYPSRSIKFAYGLESSDCSEGRNISAINLPPFSSASVPEHDKQKEQHGEVISQECRDFVMNVGGSVWALDWCPQIHEKPDCSVKCEFIAVAAHPPGSSYHKMGAPLTGRGVVQIWCLLNVKEHNDKLSKIKRPKGRPRKNPTVKPRGRPRKNPTVSAVDDMNCEIQYMPALAVQFPENSTEFPTPDGNHDNNEEILPKKDGGTNDKSTQIKNPRGRTRKNSTTITVDDVNCETQNKSACYVQVAQNSTEFLASDGNLENNEEILITYKRKRKAKENKERNEESALIKRPRRRPKSNSKEVTADDPNCEDHSMPLDVQVPEDSAEFLSPDVNHDNCNEKSALMKTLRGRPSNSKGVSTGDPNCENEIMPLDVQVPEDSAEFLSSNVARVNCNEYALPQCSVTKQRHTKEAVSACNTISTTLKSSGLKINHTEMEGRYSQDRSQPLQYENEANHQPHWSFELEAPPATCSIPEDVTLPRVVSCLAHNGKVAWDVKWRPTNISDSFCKHRMGHLAVLLGNGSLEVWEVPLPHVLRAIYMHKEGTDPRFIKLEPVFKCSMLKRGGLQSIPLTVEWSVTPPHDYLLAGCHDGTVALWKFCTSSSSKCDDTKPVLIFGGDTVPIRTVAWAPFEGDPESSNIIVTAGHEGLKFWDLRNPFRPLRSLNPMPRIIYSLDWLSNPSCIIMSFEDGTMRTISLVKAANDLPVTGEIYSGKKQPGLHGSAYSSFAIWSVQVSRLTGMVAYCGVDGAVIRFQLTTKSVETDHSRNRSRRFLCGSVTEEDSTLIINTPLSDAPFQWKKPPEKGRCAESFRDLLAKSNPFRSASNQMAETSNPDSQTLAIGAGEDVGLESGSEEALCSVKQPKRPKLNSGRKKKPEGLALVCGDDDAPPITPEADNEKSDFGNIPETFPPKVAALHRVRWNMNKGSERWLCFGGACGLVRCQEIVYSNIDKRWALKK
ncbi:General transcription factor 3C polypeptide 2 [Glycine max]|nr:General transcription factor 3C polypeptide 2 [Glycine max]